MGAAVPSSVSVDLRPVGLPVGSIKKKQKNSCFLLSIMVECLSYGVWLSLARAHGWGP